MGYEIEAIHPAASQWLTENGYEYQHEVKMPEFGRADFVGHASNGRAIIVDCKTSLGNSTGRDCVQVMDYCIQYGHRAQPALAAPKGKISAKARRIAEKRNVRVIELKIEADVFPGGSDDPDKLMQDWDLGMFAESAALHKCHDNPKDLSDEFMFESYSKVSRRAIRYILFRLRMYIKKGYGYDAVCEKIILSLFVFYDARTPEERQQIIDFFCAVENIWRIDHTTGQRVENPLREDAPYVS